MRRRDLLRAGAAVLGTAPLGATAAGHPADADAGADGDGFEPLGRLSLPGAKELVVRGAVAYVATTDGFATVDVSDPTDPTLLAERTDLLADRPGGPLAAIYDGKLGGDYYAVGGPGDERLEGLRAATVFDVSDPAAPERVLAYETDFYHHNLDVDGETLYLCGNDGDRNPLICVDVASGEELGRWSVVDENERWADVDHRLRESHDVWVEAGVAYVACWNAGTWLIDVSDPTAPASIVGLRGLDPDEQAALEGDAEMQRALLGLPGNDHFAMPARSGGDADDGGGGDGDLVVLNEEAWGADAGAPAGDLGGVELWDAAAGERLARIEASPTGDATYEGVWTTPHNFDVVGDRLYTSWYRGGVRVHDVSDPAAPEELARWRDPAGTEFWTAQRADGSVVASSWRDPSREDPEAGAAVYAFPDPGASRPADDETGAEGAGFGPLAGIAGVGVGLGIGAALARRQL
jgi:hypothetical protein